MNFEIDLVFLIKPFFCMTKKSRQKFKYLENEKSFKMKQKAFFIIFKGLSLKQIKQFYFSEGESREGDDNLSLQLYRKLTPHNEWIPCKNFAYIQSRNERFLWEFWNNEISKPAIFSLRKVFFIEKLFFIDLFTLNN